MEAVILLAHGAPESPDKVDEYVLRVRHGRPVDSQIMESIRDRYKQIGGSPLLQWTDRQAKALEKLMQSRSDDRKVYFGMRHSTPFIGETVNRMLADGVHSATAICLTPQFSQLTIGAYRRALEDAIAERNLRFTMVPSYAKHPQLIRAFAENLQTVLKAQPEAIVIFTAHSLPKRVLSQGDPYDYEVKATAVLVAKACKLSDWRFAYQSQGMTAEKWLGPTVEARLDELASKSILKVVVLPVGFVCDHLETLYDIDIHFCEYADKKGIFLFRAPSLNDSPLFVELLYQLAAR